MHVTAVRWMALVWLPILAGMQGCLPTGPPSGTYIVNTFQFVPSRSVSNADGPVPNVWIDTNTEFSGLSGGTMTSSLPCAVMIDYTDNSFTFQSAVVTAIKVTYDDDRIESSTEAATLPLQIAAREYETVNSVTGGRIVKGKAWIISGKLPKIVTRAEPLRLQMDGHFQLPDGQTIPFTVDQHFAVETDRSVKSAKDVLQDK